MAFSQISTSVTIIQSGINKGFFNGKITNIDYQYATIGSIVIESGAVAEVGGATFLADSDITISGTAGSIASGTNGYLCITPTGTSGSQTLTASWRTSISPVWIDSKGAFYASALSPTRVLGDILFTGEVVQFGTVYKTNYNVTDSILVQEYATGANNVTSYYAVKKAIIPLGVWDMDSQAQLSVVLPFTPYKVFILITADGTTPTKYPIPTGDDSAPTVDAAFTITQPGGAPTLIIDRFSGGRFDATSFSSVSISRGTAYIEGLGVEISP